jgi:sterol desaturase/sphingolipid hydroxylase (fatty acid hydroxylase superfamily)
MGLLVKMSPVQAGIISLAVAQWGNFIHANIRVNLGPLSTVLCGPQLHRVHHSIEERHRDKNFAAFFPMWDVIFGTYCKPDGWPKTGVNGVRHSLRDAIGIPRR